MHFISHYNREGFQNSYADLRLLTRALQTSEYSDNLNYNLRWADKLENREQRGDYGDQGIDKAETIRQIVSVALSYEVEIADEFARRERAQDLAEAQRLQEKWGVAHYE